MTSNISVFYDRTKNKNNIFSFIGNIMADTLPSVLETIELKLNSLKENKKITKTICNVLIECFQNIYHHADSKPPSANENGNDPNAFCIIDNKDECYSISIGNYIKNKNIPVLKNNLEEALSFSREELRTHYRTVLNNGKKSAKDGAGLGIIYISRKAEGAVSYNFVPVDENFSLFILKVEIPKLKYDENDIN